jgi:uncharacterized protein
VDQLTQARSAADQGDFDVAVAILRPLADAGAADAQFELGRLVLTECDILTGREGFEWLCAAARQGHPQAQYHVATYPSFPREPFESPLEAMALWEFLLSAAAAGIIEAQCHAAACIATGEFGDGHTIPADLVAAVGWLERAAQGGYRRAAEAGHPTGQFNLACMLINGEGCAPDRGDEQARDFLDDLAGRGPR